MRDLHNAYAVSNNELWPCMLWKKLAMVNDFVIVQIVNLGRGTHRMGRYGYPMLYLCARPSVLHNAYVVAKYEFWSSMLWKKLTMAKVYVTVQIVHWGGGGARTQTGGSMESGC